MEDPIMSLNVDGNNVHKMTLNDRFFKLGQTGCTPKISFQACLEVEKIDPGRVSLQTGVEVELGCHNNN